MDESSIASNVARAIVAALDWSSSPEARKAAVSYLESIKVGDLRILANISFLLVRKDWSSEIRLHAFKMLQHLVRLRWEELNSMERRNFANVAVDLISEMANPCEEWALKSQTAALVAEIVRREGLSLWKELLPSLVSLSNNGPIQAELVSMMLRWLPEDITVHNEDLEGDRRRLLLRGLTQSLPDILPLLYTLLERHFGAALSEADRQQLDLAKQHAATVTAILNAINAYAEWAPLPDLAKYGLVHGCGYLLSSPDFRLHACEFFKLVSPRKRPVDASASEFDSAMSNIFQILMNISRDFLCRSNSSAGGMDDSEFEFAEYICESMVSLGSSNLQCIASDSTILPLYLQEMLGYFQHIKLALHFQSLLFWLALMRDLLAKPKAAAQATGDGSAVSNLSSASGQADKEKKGILNFVNDDICSAILDVSFQRMLKREKVPPGTALSLGALELWSDEFDGKGEFSQYRSRLLELIRFVSSHKPFVAASRVSERIDTVIKSLLHAPKPAQELAIMDSLQLALETVVSVIFDGSTEFGGGSSEVQITLCRIFEGLLQQFLSLKWTEPALVEVLGRYLDALGPFLKYFPDAVGGVINKLFELLTSLPFAIKDPSLNSARHARLQICSSFIRIAKAADKVLLPHMKVIADTMGYLQREGRLLRGEHNLLGEAFLVMASAAGIQQQQEVLAWLLEPLSKQWMQVEWQCVYLSEPAGLVHLCSETSFMWSIFHTVTFFEKALKRSGVRKSNLNLQNASVSSSIPSHPMASHLLWMLPPLLRLLRAIHSLWSPSVAQTLPGEFKAAMSMSDIERASLLGEGNSKPSKGALTFTDGSQIDMNKEGFVEPNENDIRNWLKGIRDSGYNVLGLSTTLGDSFFKSMESHSVALALMENIQSMEFRHIRQLVHLVLIPLVKFCPSDLWAEWLEKLLHPLFLHCQQALSCSWSSLLREGRAKVPDMHGILTGSDLKIEVMEEKLLRDLTREICYLLSVLASPGLNNGLPSLEQFGHVNRVEASSLKDLDAFSTNSLVGFLLKHKGTALPALQISIEAFTWTDGEAVTKISSFCGAMILLAISTNNIELREFVAKDLFYAIIQGLSLESNAIISADLVGLCREIFIYLSDRDPSPRQVLLCLPCITSNDLLAFEEALTKTASPKEQKQHMKSLLLLATGNKLKALTAQKSTNVITNVSRPKAASWAL
ncbi:PREDICTED: protein HASTY 1 isoform X2 [Nelumbo nucifera]|uniref:Protein HASTY 1 isoform X2 n=1 Tax=Nelumbo nucifera TaxID=4432 RepID=A0A1U7Z3P8_NELNU|nr:PREDICTED: protein HASTY 1 isoform X2 [Nelumbo nucifera]